MSKHARHESELITLRAENERLKAKLRESNAELFSRLRESQATIERVRELPVEWRRSTDYSYYGDDKAALRDEGRESCADDLESALASAKPEPSTDARPGWVAVGVLKTIAKDLSDKASRAAIEAECFDNGSNNHRSNRARLFGLADGCRHAASELTAIADNAGDAEPVERAAFELVEASLSERAPFNDDARLALMALRGLREEDALAGKGGEGGSDAQ